MQVGQPGWHVCQIPIWFLLGQPWTCTLADLHQAKPPSRIWSNGTSIQKVTEPIFQFLGADAPQPPVLLRQGLPPRDTTLGQLTLATLWPANSLMQLDKPGWQFCKIPISFLLGQPWICTLADLHHAKPPSRIRSNWHLNTKKATEPTFKFLGAHAPSTTSLA